MSISPKSETATTWSRAEEKAFEDAIALHWNDSEESAAEDSWKKIASLVPSKSIEQLKHHFRVLEEDVNAIEAGFIAIPEYVGEESASSPKDRHKRPSCSSAADAKGGSKSEQERRRGTPWTEEEHRMFLLGLEKFGKGDWRSISRNFVVSRTPTQVASHAQKYFIRLNSMNRDRRRSSIHDITSPKNDGGGDVVGRQPNAGAPVRRSVAQSGGVSVGHPVAPPATAMGTPVMMPPGHHYPPYVVPMAYPMAPPMVHPS